MIDFLIKGVCRTRTSGGIRAEIYGFDFEVFYQLVISFHWKQIRLKDYDAQHALKFRAFPVGIGFPPAKLRKINQGG